MNRPDTVFSCMAQDSAGLAEVLLFIESLRKFGGRYALSLVRVFAGPGIDRALLTEESAPCEVLPIPRIDPACRSFFFADKVYCAAEAEALAEEEGSSFVWVDTDTLVLNEPAALVLEPGKAALLCPVMHNRTGVAWGKHPGEMWEYLDALFAIDGTRFRPVVAPADGQLIRPYFNAGLIAVDPGKQLMRLWQDKFIPLCSDPRILEIISRSPDDRIFLHQTILTEVFLQQLGLDAISVLPETYNYPLFFEELFPAIRPFNDLSEAITARYDIYFRNAQSGWQDRLKGPGEKISWLIDRLGALGKG